jgi:hypothetical protein
MTFAHVGHWLLDLLYVAPLLVMVGVLAVGRLRERRGRRRTDGGTEGGP